MYVKRLANATAPRAAALFNRGDAAAAIALTREHMHFAAGTCSCVTLRDLDAHTTVAANVRTPLLLQPVVQPHQALVLLASCC